MSDEEVQTKKGRKTAAESTKRPKKVNNLICYTTICSHVDVFIAAEGIDFVLIIVN